MAVPSSVVKTISKAVVVAAVVLLSAQICNAQIGTVGGISNPGYAAVQVPEIAGPWPQGPVVGSPVQSELIQPSPIYSPPVFSTPICSQPIYSQPIGSPPIYSSPIESKPIVSGPVYSPPVYSAPINSGPVEPKKDEQGAQQFVGRIVFNNFEGGFYGIVTDDGKRYTGIIPDELKRDGVRVKGTLRPRLDAVTTTMWGTAANIVTISPE